MPNRTARPTSGFPGASVSLRQCKLGLIDRHAAFTVVQSRTIQAASGPSSLAMALTPSKATLIFPFELLLYLKIG